MSARIEQLIINSPYQEPAKHWVYVRESQQFTLQEGRRPAGYWRASGSNKRNYDDPGEFVPIELVNRIRPRVQAWRAAGYPGITGTTKKLLEHWYDREQRQFPFFWCQLEAIETAIWLTEASPAEKQGIDIPSENDWERQCLKLATGTGKTIVMAMLIAWHALNKLANPKDTRFSKNILVMAPGITVRDRLQVLLPSDPENYYQAFSIVPSFMWQELQGAKIQVTNWHALAPINENAGPKVVKKGPESDEAFVRRVLPDFGNAQNILVINDEAHHCHRPIEGEEASETEKATIWISGIDRIHNARGVLQTYDLSATPFRPSGHNNAGEALFSWIVSDFGLNDAIESGLVKTPKVAVRDDSGVTNDFKSKLFHMYPEMKEDLNRRAEAHEGLPDLLMQALNILGGDWLKERERWSQTMKVPPVMIVICNRTETAARVEFAMLNGYTAVHELQERDRLIRVDQDALDRVESEDSATLSKSKVEQAEVLRERMNTVGKDGKPGQNIQCVVGVNMLSEGWDAKTVTHILGVRAFTSQLLCEQVVGRGLRRISYDVDPETGLLQPEYVTVFGVPFTFLPVEQSESGPPREMPPKTKIEPVLTRKNLEIRWPHVIRVEHRLKYFLDLDWSKLSPLTLSAENTPTVVEVAPTIEGHADFSKITQLDLQRLADENRMQRSKLQASVQLQNKLGSNWEGDAGSHIGQLMTLLDRFIESDKLDVRVPKTEDADLFRRVLIATNIQRIVEHIGQFIKSSSKEDPIAVFDNVRPIRSTASSPVWYTAKPTQPVQKSQISHIVMDSGWESVGFEFERDRIPSLLSWAKNDHLGFEIYYLWQGKVHAYFPDFLLRFEDNRYVIMEVKGQKKEQDKAKWAAAEEWVRAVNAHGGFGKWEFKALEDPKDIFNLV